MKPVPAAEVFERATRNRVWWTRWRTELKPGEPVCRSGIQTQRVRISEPQVWMCRLMIIYTKPKAVGSWH